MVKNLHYLILLRKVYRFITIKQYQFSNGEEDFIVTLSPSYREVKIQVTQPTSNKLLSLLVLKRVDKLEITADKKELSSVLLTVINEDSQQTLVS